MSTIEKLLQKRHLLPTDVAEIGVRRGQWAVYVLNAFPSITRYICVDIWDIYEDKTPEENLHCLGKNWCTKKRQERTYERYCKAITPFREKVVELRMFSHEAAQQVEDASLDVVYIDANHEAEYVEQDIRLWCPKLRTRGLLLGHDYDTPRGWGVKLVVDKLFGPLAQNRGAVWWVWKDQVEALGLFQMEEA